MIQDIHGVNGWNNFQSDLNRNPDFVKAIGGRGSIGGRNFFRILKHGLMDDVHRSSGVSTFHGNSFFQRFIGADPTEAEEAAKSVARAMGNNI